MTEAFATLIASVNILYSSYHRRWLSSREILGLQGFPVLTKWSHNTPCCSFAVAMQASRASVNRMAGNAMHVTVCVFYGCMYSRKCRWIHIWQRFLWQTFQTHGQQETNAMRSVDESHRFILCQIVISIISQLFRQLR